jgi:hypothetical protein
MQQLLARILTSAAIYLGARLMDEVIKELERLSYKKCWERSRVGSVLPRALEVIAGGKK